MFSKARARTWPSRFASSSQALGTSSSSAPPSASTRAASGNSRSKQIIAPTATAPARVSRRATGNSVPAASACSGRSKLQVCTLA